MDHRNLFKKGQSVVVIEQGSQDELGQLTVVECSQSVLSLTPKDDPGAIEEFGWDPDSDGWRYLFEGLGGERCVNRRAPAYTIRPL